MNITIIPTSAAEHLARKLAASRGTTVTFPDKNREAKRHFPDGEIYTRISSLGGHKGRTVVLHAGMPDPNAGLVELEMLLEILTQAKVSPLEVFFSYFPYGMQDKVFQAGETNAAENLCKKLTAYYGVSKIFTIDAHFHGQAWVQQYPLVNSSAVEKLKRTAVAEYPDVVFLTPDAGGQRRTGLKGTQKKRHHSYHVDIESDSEFKMLVRGKTIGVIDDILETGGTLERFYRHCRNCGAKNLVALITHGVLVQGIERIKKYYAKLYLTNTIDRREATIDVTSLIAGALTEK